MLMKRIGLFKYQLNAPQPQLFQSFPPTQVYQPPYSFINIAGTAALTTRTSGTIKFSVRAALFYLIITIHTL